MPDVPAGKTVVAESGISERAELEELERVGVDAVLIGGALMSAGDPEAKTRELTAPRRGHPRAPPALGRSRSRRSLSGTLSRAFRRALSGRLRLSALRHHPTERTTNAPPHPVRLRHCSAASSSPLFGWLAIAAGWIDAGRRLDRRPMRGATRGAGRRTATSGGDTNVVNQIYQRDGRASPSSKPTSPPRKSSPFEPVRPSPKAAAPRPAPASSSTTRATSSPTTTWSRARTRSGQARRLRHESYTAKVVGTDPATDVALLKVDAPADQLHPLAARRLLEGRSRRPGGRDRQPVRPRPHRDQRHRLRPAAPDPGAQRLLDLARDPDRRGDQPRQLRRPADRRRRAA